MAVLVTDGFYDIFNIFMLLWKYIRRNHVTNDTWKFFQKVSWRKICQKYDSPLHRSRLLEKGGRKSIRYLQFEQWGGLNEG